MWLVPASAAGFAAGVLALGDVRAPWPLLLAGACLVVTGASSGRRGGSPPLRWGEQRSPDRRTTILEAAGIPGTARTGPRSPIGSAALLAGMVLLGGGWTGVRAELRPGLGAQEGVTLAFEGRAAADVRPFDFGWGAEAIVSLSGREVRLWISGDHPAPPFSAGDRIAGSGRVSALDDPSSGFESYLEGRGVVGILRTSDLERIGPPGNPAMRLANAARDGLRKGAFAVLPEREAGLLLGLSIGDVRHMDPEVDRDFRATGLSHLLAVSGSNVALFLAPILSLVILLGARVRVRMIVGTLALSFFVLVTRWEPSVLRASVMAGVALVGLVAGRPRASSAALGWAVLALLVADPGLVRSVGFQLSVVATGGLVAMAAPVASRMRWLPRPVALALGATIAAQVAVSPLLLMHFGAVPTVTLLANLLAFPAVAPGLLGGVLAAALGLVWEPAGGALGGLVSVPLAYLSEMADSAAQLPLPSVTGGGAATPLVAAAVVALVTWRLRRGRRPVGPVGAAVAIAGLCWALIPDGPPRHLEVVFVDVGQGDGAVVRTPDGVTVVVDAGPAEDGFAPALAALGIRRIDLLVASHAHADHVEGFPAVLSRFPVGLAIEPGCPGPSPSYQRFARALEAEDVPVRYPRGGERLVLGALVVEVLGPDECSVDSPNDDSLVLRMRYGQSEILFPGDAEEPAQSDLLGDGDPLAADVLKVPHHGGDTSLEEFFAAVGPAVSVVSTGENSYGHPAEPVLESLAGVSERVIRTDRAGSVTVTLTPDGILVEPAG